MRMPSFLRLERLSASWKSLTGGDSLRGVSIVLTLAAFLKRYVNAISISLDHVYRIFAQRILSLSLEIATLTASTRG